MWPHYICNPIKSAIYCSIINKTISLAYSPESKVQPFKLFKKQQKCTWFSSLKILYSVHFMRNEWLSCLWTVNWWDVCVDQLKLLTDDIEYSAVFSQWQIMKCNEIFPIKIKALLCDISYLLDLSIDCWSHPDNFTDRNDFYVS